MKSISIRLSIAGALLGSLTLLAAAPAAAQIPLIRGMPQASPAATVGQTVGVATVSIDYHRPGVKERKIWGALVPYGQVWRTGANENTVITFSDPVRIEGRDLAAGRYGLHMIPTAGPWTVIFSENSTSWGSFSYREEEDALRVEVSPGEAPFAEWLDYSFADLSREAATVVLRWERLAVPIEIEFDTDEVAIAKLENKLRDLEGFDWRGWFDAARFCLTADSHHEKGLEWVDRSISMNENFSNLQVRSALLEQMGRGDEAEAALAKALGSASEVQINQAGYQYLQAGRVHRAIEMFEKNVSDHPESWNVHDSLGDGLAAKGETAQAMESYARALETAPEAQKPRIEAILEGLRSD